MIFVFFFSISRNFSILVNFTIFFLFCEFSDFGNFPISFNFQFWYIFSIWILMKLKLKLIFSYSSVLSFPSPGASQSWPPKTPSGLSWPPETWAKPWPKRTTFSLVPMPDFLGIKSWKDRTFTTWAITEGSLSRSSTSKLKVRQGNFCTRLMKAWIGNPWTFMTNLWEFTVIL